MGLVPMFFILYGCRGQVHCSGIGCMSSFRATRERSLVFRRLSPTMREREPEGALLSSISAPRPFWGTRRSGFCPGFHGVEAFGL